MKRFITATVFFILMFALCSCGEGGRLSGGASYDIQKEGMIDAFEYYASFADAEELGFKEAGDLFLSLDSNTASYGNMKRYITNGRLEDNVEIKTDEIINYFKYALPDAEEVFSSLATLTKSFWNPETYLLTLGVRSKEVKAEHYSQGNNYVFLVDVSGSMNGEMNGEKRIELVKQSFIMLLDELNPGDKVSLVTYASGVSTVLSGVDVKNKNQIEVRINELKAYGSTAGGDGLERAYKIAKDNFIEGGNNRIILASDGDFNVGRTTTSELADLVKQYANSGVYLTVLGYGMGNYRDELMSTLAKNGNGNYAYINDLSDAYKTLVEEIDNVLCVVASDVKTKISFNPDVVKEYRLIGYEGKTLSEEQYEDTNTDAGEIGSNSSIMICFELKLQDGVNFDENTKVADFEISYKDPFTHEDKLYQNHLVNIYKEYAELSEDSLFVGTIVEFVMILRKSLYKEEANLTEVIDRLSELSSVQNDRYRKEFYELVLIYQERALKQ